MSNRLSVLALLGGTFVLYPAHPAMAACAPDGTAGADVIVCSANDANGVNAGADNDTVTVNLGAVVSNSGADAINTGTGVDSVTNNGSVQTSGDNASGIADPDGGDTLLNAATGTILTTGTSSFGIEVDGDSAVTNDGIITTLGALGDAINVYGSTNLIENSSTGTLNTSGTDASGVYVVGDSNDVDNNGGIATTGDTAEGISVFGNSNHIDNYGTITTAGSSAYGIEVIGGSNILDNLGGGTITTSGDNSSGMKATGNSNIFNNFSSGSITTSGANADGMYADGNLNDLENSGAITTTGAGSDGVAASGDNNVLTNSGSITTTGEYAQGFQMDGAGNTATNSGSVSTSGDYSEGVIASGDDNIISNSVTGTITTSGLNSDGIRLIGSDSLNLGPEIYNAGSIVTSGDDADGISLTGNDSEIYNVGSISTTGGVGGLDALLGADGIEVDGDNNGVTNFAGASINTTGSDAEGIRASGDTNIVFNGGSITTGGSSAEGVLVEGSGNSVTNYSGATITTNGTNSDGIATGPGLVPNAVANVVANGGNVTVNGADSDGVQLGGVGDILTNTGTIQVLAPDVVPLFGDGVGEGSGVAVRGLDGGVTVNNSGTIVTNTGTAILTGTGADVINVTEGGTVTANPLVTGRIAVDTGAGIDAVAFSNNAVINGNVIGGADTDSLTLDGLLGEAGTLNGDSSLFESFAKNGAGTWTVNGDLGVGAASVNAGVLNLNGSAVDAGTGGTTIASGAAVNTIAGTSFVGGITNNGVFDTTANGGSVFVTDGVIDGGYTQGASGDLQIITGVFSPTTDLITSGAVSLDGNVGVAFQDEANVVFGNSTYNIVSGTSRSGTFATQSVTGITDPTITILGVQYDAISAFLSLNRSTDFLGTLSSLNEVQVALGRHLDNTTASGDVTGSLGSLLVDVVGLSDSGQKAFLQSASIGTHDDVSQAARSTTRAFVGSVKERMNLTRMTSDVGTAQQASLAGLQVAGNGSQDGLVARESSGPAFWAAGFGNHIDIDRDSNSGGRQGLQSRLWGGSLGVDFRLGDSGLLGLSGGYGSQNVDLNANGGDADIDSKFGAIYGGWYPGPFYLEGTASYARHDYDEARKIFIGPVTDTANSDHDGDQWGVNLETGFTAMSGEHYQLNPFAALEYSSLDEDGYTENGAGPLNHIIKDRVTESLRSELGAQYDHVADSMSAGELYTYARLGWVHDFEIDDRNLVASLQGTPGVFFGLDGRNLSQDGIRLGTGMTWFARSDWSVGVNFGGEWRGDETTYGAQVQVSKTLR